MPASIPTDDDPLAVLRAAGTLSADLAHRVEAALRTAEVAAATTATPTHGAAALLAACQRTGRPVAIVSNNATPAVAAYLTRTGLVDLVAHVAGRDPTSPALMKPSPHLVRRALAALGADPAAAVVVGDSPSDIGAAHAASTLTYLLPIVSVALGALILDEPLTPGLVLGGGAVLAGVALSRKPAPSATR